MVDPQPGNDSGRSHDMDTTESSNPIFAIEDAPGAGRGVFARRNIQKGEVIYTADDLSVHVLFREYRGEICCQCFAYNSGEKQPVKDLLHGLAFCSKECRDIYLDKSDETCLAARAAVEKLIKMKASQSPLESKLESKPISRPTAEETAKAWDTTEIQATSIRAARAAASSGKAAKGDLKTLQRAASAPVSPDVINFLLSAVLMHYTTRNTPSRRSAFSELESEATPYVSHAELAEYTTAYLHLVCTLPTPLLPFISVSFLHDIKTRETHNSFGIRSLDDQGSEFFGYGVWPSASYFNHSCAQNLRRTRRGRTWVFSAGRDIAAGEQLYISYVSSEDSGGDTLGWRERSANLRRTWGFECVCERCGREKAADGA
ncbi:hypothetical protein QBC47DRAFT_457158 [Echria macrotheca]|uniref:SET domain-containing protein n=1 Tax=Echria macrotheca TaxID=438768 RepID=A0AAJ0BQK2_9PEZI|nr:hypothetical protein QBC47DRAFT_457158 [Echria macrotheca]